MFLKRLVPNMASTIARMINSCQTLMPPGPNIPDFFSNFCASCGNFVPNNLHVKKITDNKKFWKTVKPCFSDKYIKAEKITLIEEENIVSDDKEVAKIFCEFFGNIVKNLDIAMPTQFLQYSENISNPVEKAIKKYENHPSIIEISKTMKNAKCFSFNEID